MRSTGKKPAIYFFSLLVAGILITAPVICRAQGSEAAPPDGPAEIRPDPLKRLPSTPREAHLRLEERKISWPGETAGGEVSSASVNSGARVSIPYDTVTGYITTTGAKVKVELWRGFLKLGEMTVDSEADNSFKADLAKAGLDILSGDVVRVQDLGGGPAMDINCLLAPSIDQGTNRVTGNAQPSAVIDVYIMAPSTYFADVPPGISHRRVRADAAGNFSADFSDLDLRPGDAALVYSTDAAGNQVANMAAGSGRSLVVYPQYDEVLGYYAPGMALSVTAGSATRNVTALKDGFFEAWFSDYDIESGMEVSCNMGGAREILVRNVTAICDPATNKVSGSGPANRTMRIVMDPYGSPVTYTTTSDSSGNFEVDLGTSFKALGSEVYNIAWYDDDGDAVVYEFQTFSWYLAEGYTGGDFDTWVLVQNPGTEDARVTLTFQLMDGSAPPKTFTVPAGQRKSVKLDDLEGLADAQVSTKVTSTNGVPVVAERAVYFNYYGMSGGHDSIGVTRLMP